MMALKPCRVCKQTVARGADPCPHCGARRPAVRNGLLLWLLLGLAWIGLG